MPMQIESYGLSDHVHVVNPGDGAAANADLYGAYERQEPWLGYQWGTNDAALLLDLVRLEEPPCSDECWATTMACAYQDATIVIAVNTELRDRAPDVIDMLRNWGFNIDRLREVSSLAERESRTPSIERRRTVVAERPTSKCGARWVTSEAADAIREALEANEIPDGWPTE